MKYIVLNIDTIIYRPKILATEAAGEQIVVSSEDVAELRRKIKKGNILVVDRLSLIETAVEKKRLQIIDQASFANTDPVFREIAITPETAAMRLAISLSLQGNTTELAYLENIPSMPSTFSSQIKVLTREEIEAKVKTFKLPDNKLKLILFYLLRLFRLISKRVTDRYFLSSASNYFSGFHDSLEASIILYEDREVVRIVWSIVLALIILGTGYLAFLYLNEIVATIQVWGTIVGTLLLGIFLFVIREKQRLTYGLVEFGIGALSVIYSFMAKEFKYSTIDFDVNFSLRLLGGLYIMVRGQDNIVKALKGTRMGKWLALRGIGQ